MITKILILIFSSKLRCVNEIEDTTSGQVQVGEGAEEIGC